jgi:hypothetical protein
MKNLILITIFTLSVFLNGCETNMSDRAIGFVSGENSDSKWHLGTQEAVDVVNIVDGLWASQDYEGMREYFADTVEVWTPKGEYTNTFDSFIESLTTGENVSWSYDYAFSVDLDPSIGGEHVQAGFSVDYPETEDSEAYIDLHHESYYVVDGKIITLRQYAIRGDSQ